MVKLTNEEKLFIKEKETIVENSKTNLAIVEEVKKFKVGDFLIAYRNERDLQWTTTGIALKLPDTKKPITNSYGAVKKYTVVCVDKHGVPYMKQLNKAGKPTGQLISPIGYNNYSGPRLTYLFEIDPNYEDAIILDDQDGYKPASDIKARADTFKDIATYNKSIRKKFKNQQEIVDHLNSLKVGDIIWRTNSSFLSIVETKPVPANIVGKVNHDVVFMKTKDQNGKERVWTFNKIKRIAFYTAQPRTFNELKNPN